MRTLPFFQLVVLSIFSTISVLAAELTPYQLCIQQLKTAQNPTVEINVQGEVHSDSRVQDRLMAEAQQGASLLLIEGAPYGSKSLLKSVALGRNIQFSPGGPFLGVEHPLATLLHEAFQHYLKLTYSRSTPSSSFYRDPANESLWLRFVDIAARNPGLFTAIQNHPEGKTNQLWQAVNLLVALGSPELALERIRTQSIYPESVKQHAQALRVLILVGIDGMGKHFPHLSPWFKNLRLSIDGHRELAEHAIGDLVIVRNYFMGLYTAKVIAANFQRKKKFVLLVGSLHVADLKRVLENAFAASIRITADENFSQLFATDSAARSDLRDYILRSPFPVPPTP